jgi:hypothetical protein
MTNPEQQRLLASRVQKVPWKKWGPYLSERQWGTVREDYSESGNAWDYFTHDQSRSRAYRWGEDGLGGISDDKQRLCFALALWNGRDPILKERLFGLTNSEGNHGEDVKEYYFYLDSTPTHAYMKYLYKYPQRPFPYEDLVQTNSQRSRHELEYELLDTGVFDDDRYWDVFIEYAKEAPEDLLIAIHVVNRGPETAVLHLLPTLWFRNTWSWSANAPRPALRQIDGPDGVSAIHAEHPDLGAFHFYCQNASALLFTDNETNHERIFGTPNPTPYVKDAFHRYLIDGEATAVNPHHTGTKTAAHYELTIEPGATHTIRLRLTAADLANGDPFSSHFDSLIATRLQEADIFYDKVSPDVLSPEATAVMRQSLAGMLWTKQYYFYNVDRWLEEHGANPFDANSRTNVRNRQWFHMINDDIISMPDKWEYPWYAAWDLAFHNLALVIVDPDFAKNQLDLLLRDLYLHPNGQIPAYEWNFGDVNPPVHAWATLFVYRIDKELNGFGDTQFLGHAFQKLVVNFTWWLNRKDREGRNVFEGGFLGLDNIGVFDRSAPLPGGGYLDQADGTAWMALYCQNMLEIALELAPTDLAIYGPMVLKFFEHFMWISAAMDRIGDHHDEMWDQADGFFYDVLRFPDGNAVRLKVRSMVGLLSLCATTVIEPDTLEQLPELLTRARRFLDHHPELTANIAMPGKVGVNGRRLLAILDEQKLRRILSHMLDEAEFLSPYGIRSLSRHHLKYPYSFYVNGEEFRVTYLPAESDSGMFGGNSNWRGPIWLPVNILLVRGLLLLYTYYGDAFTVECPTGSGQYMTLYQVAYEIAGRLTRIFLPDENGRRPVYGGSEKFQSDPHWRDYILFYEYFHGDNGAGLGASHQTGWTGIIARVLQMMGALSPDVLLREGLSGSLTYSEE